MIRFSILFLSCDPTTSLFRHLKGLASGLYRSINCSILCRNSPGLENEAPRNAFLEKMPNQISTWFSQPADVGVKWKCTFWCFSSQSSFFCEYSNCLISHVFAGCAVRLNNPYLEEGIRLLQNDLMTALWSPPTSVKSEVASPCRHTLPVLRSSTICPRKRKFARAVRL